MTHSIGGFRVGWCRCSARLLVATVTGVLAGVYDWGCAEETKSASAADPPSDAWFEDVIAESGIDFRHTSGHRTNYLFPEISTGGVCVLDFDADGLLDVYFVQGGTLESDNGPQPTNRLYRNLGNMRFEDVTEASGVGDSGYGMGCCHGDYDGDGDDDLYVTNLRANVLYRNNGDGTFTDVTEESGTGDASWSTGCAMADLNGDERPELIVINYIHWSPESELGCFVSSGQHDYCSPKNYKAPARDTLYRNDGDGRFTDVSVAAGLGSAFGNGFGIAVADYDGDGRLDLYVANDGTANQLWHQAGEFQFTESALALGCALNRYGWAEAGMGVAAVDIENDGDVDLYMSHLEEETNTLYVNTDGVFDDVTTRTGLAPASKGFTGFGLGFADFNHDGELDLYVANGRVKRSDTLHDPADVYAEPNHVFRGLGSGRFAEMSPRGGTRTLLAATSRAAAFGDLDNDGDVDIVVANKDGRPHLLRNISSKVGNWVMFRVLDGRGRDALYARVRAATGDRSQWRTVQTAYSYCAGNDPRVHFGLGHADQVDSVAVYWPDGASETFGPFAANSQYTLQRGRGR